MTYRGRAHFARGLSRVSPAGVPISRTPRHRRTGRGATRADGHGTAERTRDRPPRIESPYGGCSTSVDAPIPKRQQRDRGLARFRSRGRAAAPTSASLNPELCERPGPWTPGRSPLAEAAKENPTRVAARCRFQRRDRSGTSSRTTARCDTSWRSETRETSVSPRAPANETAYVCAPVGHSCGIRSQRLTRHTAVREPQPVRLKGAWR